MFENNNSSLTKLMIPRRNRGKLHAILYRCQDIMAKKNPLVILCHGFTGDKYEWDRFPKTAKILNEYGFDAIIFDFSGSGENKREPVLLSKQVIDLIDVYSWGKMNNYTDFAIIGLSFGGLTSLIANIPVKTIVFWAPAFYMNRITTEIKSIHFPYQFPSVTPPDIFIDENFVHELKKINVNNYLMNFTTPSIIIHGELDSAVRAELSKQALCHMPADRHHKLHLVKNADHLFDGKELDEFIEKTLEWLSEYL